MEVPPNSLFLLVAGLAVAAVGALVWRMAGHGGDRKIRVVGVGGGGANTVEAMIRARLKGIEYVVVNTDARALQRSSARTKIAIGRQITNGLGTGGDAGAGEVAARDATDHIGRALTGCDFVVITAGLGGGTGSGAVPVIAEIARQKGALTMAVVTTPFAFEGSRRRQLAQAAEKTLAGKVDAVATIPNDRVREQMPATATIEDAFRTIDETLCQTVGEILNLVAVRGRLNLDFADVRAALQGGGAAAVGTGRATGENRAVDAARGAIATALPGGSKAGPSSVLVNLSGSNKLRLAEVDAVTETVLAAAGRDANIVFGMSLRPRLRDEVQVTIIATGLDKAKVRSTDAAAATSAEARASAADETAPAWRPVWLRRADARSPASAPKQRTRRKSLTRTEVESEATSDST
jgi:cell division protein FtsZ